MAYEKNVNNPAEAATGKLRFCKMPAFPPREFIAVLENNFV